MKVDSIFLETYFGLTCVGSKGDNFAAMFDDDEFVLTLMKGREVYYPKTFHVKFPQANEEQVDRINHQLKAEGLRLYKEKIALQKPFFSRL